mgnify:CR=1 FL=1
MYALHRTRAENFYIRFLAEGNITFPREEAAWENGCIRPSGRYWAGGMTHVYSWELMYPKCGQSIWNGHLACLNKRMWYWGLPGMGDIIWWA